MINEIKNRFGQLIADKNWKILKSELSDLEPFQIAEAIGELPGRFRSDCFRASRRKRLSNISRTISARRLSTDWPPTSIR